MLNHSFRFPFEQKKQLNFCKYLFVSKKNMFSSFKKQAVHDLKVYKRIFNENKTLINSFNFPNSINLRDVFREVKQSTDVENSISIISKLDVADVEVGSLLALPDVKKKKEGINLLLKRVASTRSDINQLLDFKNKNKTFSFLVGVPKKEPCRYLLELLEFMNKARKYQIKLRPAFFMSANLDYSLKNQNMNPDQAIELHRNVFNFLKCKGSENILKKCILYISMPHSNLDKTSLMMQDFPGLISFGDTNGSLKSCDLKKILNLCLNNQINPDQWSLHLHGNPTLTLHQDLKRICGLLICFFKMGGASVDGNCLPIGFKNQISGLSESNERSGNLSFKLLIKLLVSLNIGSFDSHVDSYANILKLQYQTKSIDLFENSSSLVIEKAIKQSLFK